MNGMLISVPPLSQRFLKMNRIYCNVCFRFSLSKLVCILVWYHSSINGVCVYIISMISSERDDVSNYQSIDTWFNNWFRRITAKHQNILTIGFHAINISNTENVSSTFKSYRNKSIQQRKLLTQSAFCGYHQVRNAVYLINYALFVFWCGILTLDMMHWSKLFKSINISHHIMEFKRRRPDYHWSNPTCCLSYTVNTILVDALATSVSSIRNVNSHSSIHVIYISSFLRDASSLRWRHNDHDGVSIHQPHGLLNRLFRRRSKKTSNLCVTGLCVGNSPGPVNSPHKGQLRGKYYHLMT